MATGQKWNMAWMGLTRTVQGLTCSVVPQQVCKQAWLYHHVEVLGHSGVQTGVAQNGRDVNRCENCHIVILIHSSLQSVCPSCHMAFHGQLQKQACLYVHVASDMQTSVPRQPPGNSVSCCVMGVNMCAHADQGSAATPQTFKEAKQHHPVWHWEMEQVVSRCGCAATLWHWTW